MLVSRLYRRFKGRTNRDGPDAGPRDDSTPSAPTPSQPPRPESSLRWRLTLLIALAIPVFLETLDYTVVATAQTNIATGFAGVRTDYIGTSYLLTSTVFLPVFAAVADVYGRHWALQISFAFFIIGSAISTAAQNMVMMIAGRGVAGIGAAGMLTVVRIILADSASLDDNTWQVSMLFILYALAFSVGPLIGGLLVSVSFRWVFAINIPCCFVASLLCFFLLRNKVKTGQPSRRSPITPNRKETWLQKLLHIDWVGGFLFISAGILVLLGLNWGSNERWNSAKVIVTLVIGSLLFIACIGWEYILELQEESSSPSSWTILKADPMLPLVVFRSYDVSTVQYTCFVSGMVMLVMFYFIAIFMTIVTGYSAIKAGVQLVFFAPGMGLGTGMSIFLIKRLRQPKYPIILGGAVISVSLGIIAMGMNRRHQVLVDCFLAVAGVGTGLQIGSLAVHARFSMPAERVAIVSALSLFFRSFGGTIGLAQCTTVLNAKVKANIISLINSGVISSSELVDLSKASTHGALNSLQGIKALPPHLQDLIRNAFRRAVMWCFISLIPWSILSFVLTLFLSNIEDTDKTRQEAQPDVPEKNVGTQLKVEGDTKELAEVNIP